MRTFLAVVLSFLISATALAGEPARVDVLDPHRLPLGDGRVSSEPQRGDVWSCMTHFSGGGAMHDGGWIHGDVGT
ncbi:MAG: hypothetical protein GC190_00150 [Alphaproteobacteria bacterium]|nr:hypothetical protein [Alphaproteobacteria bacterium]